MSTDGQPGGTAVATDPVGTAAEMPHASAIGPVGGPAWVGWREGALTRAHELEALCDWIWLEHPRKGGETLVVSIKGHLDAAREAAGRVALLKRIHSTLSGALIERAKSNLDAAEAQLLNLAPPDYVRGQMPSLLRHVRRHLRSTDPGRQEFERIARRVGICDPDRLQTQVFTEQDVDAEKNTVENERGKIVTTVRAASSEALREHIRLRNFRNVVVITGMLLAVLAAGLAITGFIKPTLLPLCFLPEQPNNQVIVVCPTEQSNRFFPAQRDLSVPAQPPQQGGQGIDIDVKVAETAKGYDILVAELVGLTAAAIAAAAAISHIKGSSERFGLPVALVALKLPTGALTAVLGLLLMRGQFVPGLGALDTPAQILAWALVFGYAQQLFTRLIDQQGQSVLESVRSADTPQPGRKA